ncbi:unnamed protein product, partial [Mesorhabditis spiculigera]
MRLLLLLLAVITVVAGCWVGDCNGQLKLGNVHPKPGHSCAFDTDCPPGHACLMFRGHGQCSGDRKS